MVYHRSRILHHHRLRYGRDKSNHARQSQLKKNAGGTRTQVRIFPAHASGMVYRRSEPAYRFGTASVRIRLHGRWDMSNRTHVNPRKHHRN